VAAFLGFGFFRSLLLECFRPGLALYGRVCACWLAFGLDAERRAVPLICFVCDGLFAHLDLLDAALDPSIMCAL